MWVDVSFGPQVGKEKGKSRYGYLVKFLSGTTAWCTKMSKRVFDSSTEAECNGVNEIRKENVWQRDLQTCLGLFKPETTVVWEDNTAAIALAGAGSFHSRSKHFGLEWYATKEAIELKEFEMKYTKTSEQPQAGDFFTKILTGTPFKAYRAEIMGEEELQLHFGVLTPPIAEEDEQ